MKALRVITMAVFLFAAIHLRAADLAWQDGAEYRPPNFATTFPLDAEGSKKLEALIGELERGFAEGTNVFEVFRLGLRGLSENRVLPALRGFGNTFIWGKSPQDPRAIELMYHASGSTNANITRNAIYFGLSVVRPMTDSILRTLVEVSMKTEDANVLSRVAWGASAEKGKLVSYLKPHLESTNPEQRKHAKALRSIFSGEVKAFAWAEERARDAAKEKFSAWLPEVRKALEEGNSEARGAALDLIERNRITLIMDESFIPAFAAAARDEDPKIRNQVAVTAGGHWVWGATNQSSAAIDLMMTLSRDPDRQVRHSANYYGLSVIQNRSDAVVERTLELAVQELDDGDIRQRIRWGLRDEQATLRRTLEKWIAGEDVVKALFAYGFFLDQFAEKPAGNANVRQLLDSPEKPVANIVAFGPTAGWRPQSLADFVQKLRDELPGGNGGRTIWVNDKGPPFVIVDEREGEWIKSKLAPSARFKVAFEKPLTVAELVRIGKEGGLKGLKQ